MRCGFSTGPSRDRALKTAENRAIEVVGVAATCEKILQVMLVVVLGGELENRLSRRAREPNDSLPCERVGPVEIMIRACPRCFAALEFCGGGEIEIDLRVRMFLQEARGNRVRHRAFDRARDDGRLALAKRNHHHALGFENRAHAHRDRARRHVLFAEEIAGGVFTRDTIERDETRAARA